MAFQRHGLCVLSTWDESKTHINKMKGKFDTREMQVIDKEY